MLNKIIITSTYMCIKMLHSIYQIDHKIANKNTLRITIIER